MQAQLEQALEKIKELEEKLQDMTIDRNDWRSNYIRLKDRIESNADFDEMFCNK